MKGGQAQWHMPLTPTEICLVSASSVLASKVCTTFGFYFFNFERGLHSSSPRWLLSPSVTQTGLELTNPAALASGAIEITGLCQWAWLCSKFFHQLLLSATFL